MGDERSDDVKPADEDTIADAEWWSDEDESEEVDEEEVDEDEEVLFITSDIDQILGFVVVGVVVVLEEEAVGDARRGLKAEGVADLLASPPEAHDEDGLET